MDNGFHTRLTKNDNILAPEQCKREKDILLAFEKECIENQAVITTSPTHFASSQENQLKVELKI